VLIPLIGSAVLVYGVYEFVQPSQPTPANVFWAWILGIVLVAAVATAIVYMRRPGALQRAVASGPEYIVPEGPGGVPESPAARRRMPVTGPRDGGRRGRRAPRAEGAGGGGRRGTECAM
jgi:hypothetical protein